jgi:hypothetical protein
MSLIRILSVVVLLANVVGSPVSSGAEPEQFIVLNGVPLADLDEVSHEFSNSPGARVQVGVAAIFSYLGQPRAKTASDLREFLHRSQQAGLPVVVQLDGENWWGARPDSWNWWGPAAPGYSESNRENVEWTGWSPDDAIKIAWRNWGRQLRVRPPPNLVSASIGHRDVLLVTPRQPPSRVFPDLRAMLLEGREVARW